VALLCVLALTGCLGGEEPQPIVDPETAAEMQRLQAQEDEALLSAAEEDLRYGRDELALERLMNVGEPLRSAPRTRYAFAEASLGTGNANNAYALYQSLMDEPSFRARALQGLGLTELTLGREDAAASFLEQAVALDASLWRAWNALGRYHDNREAWRDAEDAYSKALALAPDNATIPNNLGISYTRQQRYAEAEGQFRRALAINPDLDAAQTNLRLAVAWQGRYAEALTGVSDDEAADALNNVGYIAMRNGDYHTAERLLLRAIEISPTYHTEAEANLSRLRVLQGQPGVSQPSLTE
jgi:Flp pilus assembly protein TadD